MTLNKFQIFLDYLWTQFDGYALSLCCTMWKKNYGLRRTHELWLIYNFSSLSIWLIAQWHYIIRSMQQTPPSEISWWIILVDNLYYVGSIQGYSIRMHTKVIITCHPITRTPFAEEMHSAEVLWQKGDLKDLETLTTAARTPVLETRQPIQMEAPLSVSDQTKQHVSPLLFQTGAKAQRKPPLSCTYQPVTQGNPRIT